MFTETYTYQALNRLTGETMRFEATCDTEASHVAAAHWGVCWDSLRVRKARHAMDDAVEAYRLAKLSRDCGESDAYADAQATAYILGRTFPAVCEAYFENDGPDMPAPEGDEDSFLGTAEGFEDARIDNELGY